MRCSCFYRDREWTDIIAFVVFEDKTVWGIHPRCPVHGIEPIEVVYAPVFARQTATAPAATGAQT